MRHSRRAAVTGLILLACAGSVGAADPVGIPWRFDYNAARKEAAEKGLPVVVVIGGEDCIHCKRQDATTFKDPAIVALLANQFIPVRMDGHKEAAFVAALRVEVLPTTIVASPDGKILGFLQGYTSAEQLNNHLRRAVLNATTPDWVARDLKDATKAIAGSDYARGVFLLKGIVADSDESPARAKASQVLAEVERTASDKLARARELEGKGEVTAAAGAYADVLKSFVGTQAADDAVARLTGAAGDLAGRPRVARARDLLATARADYKAGRFADCLDQCEVLTSQFGDLPEGKDGLKLAASVKDDPDLLAAVCAQMNERTAAMFLTLAESWTKKGQLKEAQACLEKAVKLSPGGKTAELAQVKLSTMPKGNTSAVTVGFEKNK